MGHADIYERLAQVKQEITAIGEGLAAVRAAVAEVRDMLARAGGLSGTSTARVSRPDVVVGVAEEPGTSTARVSRPDVVGGVAEEPGTSTARVSRPDVVVGAAEEPGTSTARVSRPDVVGGPEVDGGRDGQGRSSGRRATLPFDSTKVPRVEIGGPEGEEEADALDSAATGAYARPRRETQTYFLEPGMSSGEGARAEGIDPSAVRAVDPPVDLVTEGRPSETLEITSARAPTDSPPPWPEGSDEGAR